MSEFDEDEGGVTEAKGVTKNMRQVDIELAHTPQLKIFITENDEVVVSHVDEFAFGEIVNVLAGPFKLYRGTFYHLIDGIWTAQKEKDVIKVVHSTLASIRQKTRRGSKPVSSSVNRLKNVLWALASLPEVLTEDTDAGDEIPLSDVLLSPTDGLLRQFHNKFLPHRLPISGYEWESRKSPDQWLKFLDEGFETQGEKDLLQEFFGYTLMTEAPYQRAMWLYGYPASGKSTIFRILTALLGQESVWAGGAKDLTGRFKPLSFASARLLGLPDFRIGVDSKEGLAFLLNVVGGDPVQIEAKYKDTLTIRPTGKVLVLSNELPNLRDNTGASMRRLLILQRHGSAVNKQDPNLEKKLLSELPGILGWAIEGLKRLRARGDFDLSMLDPELKSQAARATNDLIAFAEDCIVFEENGPTCDRDSGFFAKSTELFEAYRKWAKDNNQHFTKTKEQFLVAFKQTYQSKIKKTQLRTGIGNGVRGYFGIRLKEEIEYVEDII